MTEQTITFTPEAGLRKGFIILLHGISLIAASSAKIFDKSVHRFPYAYIIATLLASLLASFVCIAGARQERDAAAKRAYTFEQRLDSITMINEARKETSYVYHAE